MTMEEGFASLDILFCRVNSHKAGSRPAISHDSLKAKWSKTAASESYVAKLWRLTLFRTDWFKFQVLLKMHFVVLFSDEANALFSQNIATVCFCLHRKNETTGWRDGGSRETLNAMRHAQLMGQEAHTKQPTQCYSRDYRRTKIYSVTRWKWSIEGTYFRHWRQRNAFSTRQLQCVCFF